MTRKEVKRLNGGMDKTSRIIKIPNGDTFTKVSIYECEKCLDEFSESDYHYLSEEKCLCCNCGFLEGYLTEKQIINAYGLSNMFEHAEFREGVLNVWNGDVKPWELKNAQYRKTKQYKEWRKQVLSRDNHKCKKCNSKNNLHAHHIKSFSKYEKLRYEVSNGLTLCETCHRLEHKKGG